MAEKLDAFPEVTQRSALPLDEWLDGSAWKLTKGEDFEGSTTSVRSALSTGAKARGLKLRTRSRKEDDVESLVVQAYRPEREPAGAERTPKPSRRRDVEKDEQQA